MYNKQHRSGAYIGLQQKRSLLSRQERPIWRAGPQHPLMSDPADPAGSAVTIQRVQYIYIYIYMTAEHKTESLVVPHHDARLLCRVPLLPLSLYPWVNREITLPLPLYLSTPSTSPSASPSTSTPQSLRVLGTLTLPLLPSPSLSL